MNFYKVSSPQPVAKIVADKILDRLGSGQKVFWLVTGGTAIALEVIVSQLLKDTDQTNLTVALTDERYGPIGHADSNWYQLEQAGFNLPGASLVPILQGEDRATSTQKFAKVLAENFASADYSLGQFGIGPDGHTAGILPGSPHLHTDELAISYSDDEVAQSSPQGVKRGLDRITMTAAAIAKLDEAVVSALGDTKRPTLDMLEQDLPVEKQIAQALKKVPQLSIYNDYKGEVL